ncbi:Villin headpiece domain-containing protein [Prochlorococcus marinus str. MU1402]|nr:Villin headpiece domain-containing protein [Prochlorococcus marinus str. MU1402]
MGIYFQSKKFLNLLNFPLILYLIFCEINILNKRLYANTKPPASKEDVFLYKQMGASFLCKSINDKIDFDFNKSFAVSTYTFAEVIFSKHGNLIQEAGNEKLTTQRVLYIGEIEILNSAIKICPKQIPNDIKKKFEETINNLKKQNKKK